MILDERDRTRFPSREIPKIRRRIGSDRCRIRRVADVSSPGLNACS
jgi:hypothetical protein